MPQRKSLNISTTGLGDVRLSIGIDDGQVSRPGGEIIISNNTVHSVRKALAYLEHHGAVGEATFMVKGKLGQ